MLTPKEKEFLALRAAQEGVSMASILRRSWSRCEEEGAPLAEPVTGLKEVTF